MSKRSKEIQAGVYTRLMKFESPVVDGDRIVIPASLSSEEPVERSFGNEVLSHEKGAADLSRAANGLTLLWNHDTNEPIGKVENVRLDNGRLRGDLVFHDITERARNAAALARDGWIDGVSIGYRIKEWIEEKGSDIVRATRWVLYEASVAPIPADSTVGAYRSENFAEEITMTDETTPVVGGDSDGAKVVEVSKASFNRGMSQGKKAALGELQARVRAINEMFDQYFTIFPHNEELRGLHMDLITNGSSLEQARAALLTALPGYYAEPTGTGFKQSEIVRQVDGRSEFRSTPHVELRRDEVDTLADKTEQALLIRAGMVTDKDAIRDARQAGIAGLTLVEMGRKYLDTTGRGSVIRNLDKHGIAKAMLNRAGPMTHSDFPYVLANVATKIAKKGYTEANTTYQEWANIAYLPDFKPATIPGLGAFTDLDEIPLAGGPYLYGTMGEAAETATLKTYGKIFGLSRAAIVNDDLMQFSRTGISMGAAAARKVNQLAYTILNSGQTMTEDSTTLFDASTHANYVASGTAPSVSTLNVAEAAMAKQKAPRVATDSTNAYLNITPGHLIVPVALMGSARVLVASTYDPAGTAGTLTPNPWMGRLSVSADPLLDATSTTAWFMAAPKGNSTIDTVTVFFLEGSNGEPMVEEEEQFTSDGISYKVRIDAVARALDWRGMYKNSGTGG